MFIFDLYETTSPSSLQEEISPDFGLDGQPAILKIICSISVKKLNVSKKYTKTIIGAFHWRLKDNNTCY